MHYGYALLVDFYHVNPMTGRNVPKLEELGVNASINEANVTLERW